MNAIGVIGAGHVGCAIAFDGAERGFDVVLRTIGSHTGSRLKIEAKGNILEATGALSGQQSIKTAQGLGSDFVERVIFVAVPSQGHDEVLSELAMHDLSGRIVIFITGNGVAARARQILNANVILDTASSPYSSRVTADGGVSVRGIKKRLQIGALPAALGDDDRDQIGQLFRMPLEWSPTLLEIFFSGLNGVVHVPTALLNLGWIETTNGDFYFYRQGMSSGVCSIIEAADRERLAVAEAYGCRVSSALDTFNANYGTEEKSMRDFANNTDAHNRTKGAQKRFLEQDVPYWLVLCSDLGARAGVPTPFVDVLILLATQFSGVNYKLVGRTLKSMGLADATVQDVRNAFTGAVKGGATGQTNGTVRKNYQQRLSFSGPDRRVLA